MNFAGDTVTDRLRRSTELADKELAGGAFNRRFACPGLFRIVPSRDGGICRIKLPRGQVTAGQLRAIADAAERYAAPVVEATNRGNIQIRGVRVGTDDDLIPLLIDAGLGSRTEGADDVRNVMVSPVAGIDPAALIDVTGLADRILARLESQPAYHKLSPKFSIQIDGGESVAMARHPNDIWFAATDAAHFAFGFAGCPPVSDTTDIAVGIIAVADVETTLFAILDLFLPEIGKTNSAGTAISRLRHFLVDVTTDEIVSRLPCPVAHDIRGWHRAEPIAFGHLGQRMQINLGNVSLGAVPPLGRLTLRQLRGVAAIADAISGGEVRMTPWQSILLPNVTTNDAATALAKLEELGFITIPDRALAAIVTCAGSVGCASGHVDTKADALALAALLDARKIDVFGLHLTGCAKSCAAPRPAPVTLLGVSPGHYDVFLQSDGELAGFGKRVGADLTIEQAGDLLANTYSRVPE